VRRTSAVWSELRHLAAKNHPTEEHLLPLFVALGAAGEDVRAKWLHASTTHGVLPMDVYGFLGGPPGR
jgi:4,5-DOPA dioxygenase extradiol